MNSKQDSRIIDSKTWLRDSFLTLLITTPFEDITIKQITEKAGVSRQTFYAHYTRKEDILCEILDLFFYEISSKLLFISDQVSLMRTLVAHLKSKEDFLRILFNANLDVFIVHQLECFLSQVCLKSIQSHRQHTSVIRDNDLITFLASGCYFTAKKILASKEEVDLDYYCQALFSIIDSIIMQ